MANDFGLNDPRLRDPIRQIPDGLRDPVQDKVPGFFNLLGILLILCWKNLYQRLFING